MQYTTERDSTLLTQGQKCSKQMAEETERSLPYWYVGLPAVLSSPAQIKMQMDIWLY